MDGMWVERSTSELTYTQLYSTHAASTPSAESLPLPPLPALPLPRVDRLRWLGASPRVSLSPAQREEADARRWFSAEGSGDCLRSPA
jgi:hypothetical protein